MTCIGNIELVQAGMSAIVYTGTDPEGGETIINFSIMSIGNIKQIAISMESNTDQYVYDPESGNYIFDQQ